MLAAAECLLQKGRRPLCCACCCARPTARKAECRLCSMRCDGCCQCLLQPNAYCRKAGGHFAQFAVPAARACGTAYSALIRTPAPAWLALSILSLSARTLTAFTTTELQEVIANCVNTVNMALQYSGKIYREALDARLQVAGKHPTVGIEEWVGGPFYLRYSQLSQSQSIYRSLNSPPSIPKSYIFAIDFSMGQSVASDSITLYCPAP